MLCLAACEPPPDGRAASPACPAEKPMHAVNILTFLSYTQVSAFCTAAHIKFLLLHDGKSDDVSKLFFRDVYEVYLKASSPSRACFGGQ